MDAPELSIVVLAYRSAETIENFVESLVHSLEEEELIWEIILVGNYFEGTNRGNDAQALFFASWI